MIIESRLRRLIRRELLKEKKGSKLPKGFDYNTKTSGGNPEDWQSLPEDGEVKVKVQKITKQLNKSISNKGLNLTDVMVAKILMLAREKDAVPVFVSDERNIDLQDLSGDNITEFLESLSSVKSIPRNIPHKKIYTDSSVQVWQMDSNIWTSQNFNQYYKIFDMLLNVSDFTGNANIKNIRKKSSELKKVVSKFKHLDPKNLTPGDGIITFSDKLNKNTAEVAKKQSDVLQKILNQSKKENVLVINEKNPKKSILVSGKNIRLRCEMCKTKNPSSVENVAKKVDEKIKIAKEVENLISINDLKTFYKKFTGYYSANMALQTKKLGSKDSDKKKWKKLKKDYIVELNKLSKKISSKYSSIDSNLAREILNKNYWLRKNGPSFEKIHRNIAYRVAISSK
jgi:hypothetical protein